jgi:CheY-like chemotaxis protein
MKSVLVIDDNSDITELVETILESAGYKCTLANSGKDGLALIHKSHASTNSRDKYDLILMDIAMPEVTGPDIVKDLKDKGLLASNKVVFFTASSITGPEIAELKKIGALDCLRKPFTKDDLLSFIAKYA